MILDRIDTPNDLKTLSIDEMKILADEMRELIIKKVNEIGGHMAPNLGIVETTIAMHYVFNSPIDKFVFDVSHQCYPHKMLTERKEGFLKKENYYKFTGYTAPEESVHDLFKIGHTSTSVSLGVGVAKARDLKGEKNNVIALIGDGSLSGGEAFEGLNNGATLNSNFIVIVNDNDMSIAENYGGLYENLKLLKETKGSAELNFFKTMGYNYLYLDDGNDIEKLIELFNKIKDINHPIVLHIKTLKGKGLEPAEKNKEMFHWTMPHILDNEKIDFPKNNNDYIREYLLNKAKEDKTLVAITAGTPGAVGFTKDFRYELNEQYTDVAISEPHAIAYVSGLAKSGAKPVFSVLSSFVQRTYDQLSQDLALNNSPATLLINWAGISGQDSTHLGVFDIPLISNIPNIVYLAPTNREELFKMLDYSIEQNEHPIAIRIPLMTLKEKGVEDKTDYSILNKFKTLNKGENIAIIGVGDFYELGEKVQKELNKKGFNPTMINPIYLTGLDEDVLNKLKENHKIVITLENGVLDGGFGEKISRFYSNSDMKVLNYGAKKEFTDRIPMDKLYEQYRLVPDLIVEDIINTINIKATV